MITDQKVNKQIVGIYLIDGTNEGFQLGTTKKPNWLRRVVIRIFLGWKWIDIKNLKTVKHGN